MASNSVFAELLRNYKLDGSNFTIWKRKINFLLPVENIDYVIATAEPDEPADDASDEEKENFAEEMKDWTKDNKKARVFILGSTSDSLAGEYESEKTAYKIMRRLEEDFGEVSLIKVLSLVHRFLTAKMSDGSSVNEHMNKLSVLSEELKIAGYPFQEEVLVMVALNSLPNSWEQFKISFCNTERTLNMRTLRHHLLMEEDRKKSQGKEKNSYAAKLHLGEYKNQGNKRNFQRKKDDTDLREKINRKRDRDYRKESDGRRDKGDRWNDQSKQKFDKKNYKCHSRGEFGHFRSECSKRKKPNDSKGNSSDQDTRKGNQPPEAAGLY